MRPQRVDSEQRDLPRRLSLRQPYRALRQRDARATVVRAQPDGLAPGRRVSPDLAHRRRGQQRQLQCKLHERHHAAPAAAAARALSDLRRRRRRLPRGERHLAVLDEPGPAPGLERVSTDSWRLRVADRALERRGRVLCEQPRPDAQRERRLRPLLDGGRREALLSRRERPRLQRIRLAHPGRRLLEHERLPQQRRSRRRCALRRRDGALELKPDPRRSMRRARGAGLEAR